MLRYALLLEAQSPAERPQGPETHEDVHAGVPLRPLGVRRRSTARASCCLPHDASDVGLQHLLLPPEHPRQAEILLSPDEPTTLQRLLQNASGAEAS